MPRREPDCHTLSGSQPLSLVSSHWTPPAWPPGYSKVAISGRLSHPVRARTPSPGGSQEWDASEHLTRGLQGQGSPRKERLRTGSSMMVFWEGLAETGWVQVSHVRLVGTFYQQSVPGALYTRPVHYVRDGGRQGVSTGYLHLEGASKRQVGVN